MLSDRWIWKAVVEYLLERISKLFFFLLGFFPRCQCIMARISFFFWNFFITTNILLSTFIFTITHTIYHKKLFVFFSHFQIFLTIFFPCHPYHLYQCCCRCCKKISSICFCFQLFCSSLFVHIIKVWYFEMLFISD